MCDLKIVMKLAQGDGLTIYAKTSTIYFYEINIRNVLFVAESEHEITNCLAALDFEL